MHPSQVLSLTPNARILVLRMDRIGDVLISQPFLAQLRRHVPHASISVLLGQRNALMASYVERYADRSFVYRKKLGSVLRLIRALRQSRFDLVIDMHDNASRTSNVIMRLCGARYRLGFDKENRAIYTHTVPRADRSKVHIVDLMVSLMSAFGVEVPSSSIRLESPDDTLCKQRSQAALKNYTDVTPLASRCPDEPPSQRETHVSEVGQTPAPGSTSDSVPQLQPLPNAGTEKDTGSSGAMANSESDTSDTFSYDVCLNISAGKESMRWGQEKWIALVDMLRADDATIRICVGSEIRDRDQRHAIAARCSVAEIPDCPSLSDYAHRLRSASYLVSPDTSIVHIAASQSTPCVVLYAFPHADRMPWYPYSVDYEACVVKKEDSAISAISVEEVGKALKRLIERHRR